MKFNYHVDYPNKTIFGKGISFFGKVYTDQAICSPNDIFSILKGKEVVRLKITRRQLKFIEKNLNEEIRNQTKHLDEVYAHLNYLNNKKRKLSQKREKIEEKLKEM